MFTRCVARRPPTLLGYIHASCFCGVHKNIMSCIRERCMPDVCTMFTRWMSDVFTHKMHSGCVCVCVCVCTTVYDVRKTIMYYCSRDGACRMCVRCSQDACRMCVRCSQDACRMCVRCSQKRHVFYTVLGRCMHYVRTIFSKTSFGVYGTVHAWRVLRCVHDVHLMHTFLMRLRCSHMHGCGMCVRHCGESGIKNIDKSKTFCNHFA